MPASSISAVSCWSGIAPLLAEVPVAAGLLVVVGAFTAIVAALVTTTRISIKVALAWSTCAQMGFMLMQCGLGLWTMALVHLVAHSLYKAHAFLSAGGVVRQTMVRQLGQPLPPAGIGSQLGAAAMAVAMTVLAGLLVGPQPGQQPALWVMAGILALALAPMLRFAPSRGLVATMPRAAATAFGLACVYFALHAPLDGRIGPADTMSAAPWWAIVAPAFALLFVLQCVVTARPGGTLATRLYPWFYGGLFLDDHFGRAVFRLWPPPRVNRRAFATTAADAA
jgi:NAD(P)H-quinone oxidoreductase subunit 5